jgi:hypothetical protein
MVFHARFEPPRRTIFEFRASNDEAFVSSEAASTIVGQRAELTVRRRPSKYRSPVRTISARA